MNALYIGIGVSVVVIIIIVIVLVVVLRKKKSTPNNSPPAQTTTTIAVNFTGDLPITNNYQMTVSTSQTVSKFISSVLALTNETQVFYWSQLLINSYNVKLDQQGNVIDTTILNTLFPTLPPTLNVVGTLSLTPIQQTTYYVCAQDPDSGENAQMCVPAPTGTTGAFTEKTCGNTCACADGYVRNEVDNNCYKTPFVHGGGNGMDGGGIYDENGFYVCHGNGCLNETNPCNGGSNISYETTGWTASCNKLDCDDVNCKCYCQLESIPYGYMYCDATNLSWSQCKTKGGCVGSAPWAASYSLGGGLACDDASLSYCKITSNNPVITKIWNDAYIYNSKDVCPNTNK